MSCPLRTVSSPPRPRDGHCSSTHSRKPTNGSSKWKKTTTFKPSSSRTPSSSKSSRTESEWGNLSSSRTSTRLLIHLLSQCSPRTSSSRAASGSSDLVTLTFPTRTSSNCSSPPSSQILITCLKFASRSLSSTSLSRRTVSKINSWSTSSSMNNQSSNSKKISLSYSSVASRDSSRRSKPRS